MTYMSPQISYLATARPFSISMSNTIRYLKSQITILASMESDLPERDVSILGPRPSSMFDDVYRSQAKELLCDRLDNFARDRIVLADYLIQETAVDKITENSTVFTFAKCVGRFVHARTHACILMAGNGADLRLWNRYFSERMRSGKDSPFG
jgi:translation initiation factor eIF-2B subunit delta